jgi:dephospho-CoA kinase
MAEKIVIGLTGNIATGKSLVLRMLQELGAAAIDADKLVHEVMAPGGSAYQIIVEQFGKFVVDSNGLINRDRLGRIAFAVPEAMARLEAITHPAVRQEILARIYSAQAPVVVVEAIKLFESGLMEHCQAAWVVTSPPDIQLKRLVERRKMSPEQAQQRIKAQSSQEEKVAKADVVIDNSGELAKTWAFIKKQYTALLGAQLGVAPPAVAEPAPAPEAAKPAAEIQVTDISIRRAKRQDLEAMANLVAVGTKGASNPDLSQMMELLFSRAYIVALAGDYVVGVAGWQTENLIAGLQDFYMLRDDLWPVIGPQMLEMIHEEVHKLSCEVSLAFVLNQAGSKPIEFFESQSYEQAQGKDLGYMWKDAAKEWQPEDSVLLYKKLREQRIMVPM